MKATRSSSRAIREARPLTNGWHVRTKQPFSARMAANSLLHIWSTRGVGDRVGRPVHVPEERGVVEQPLDRHLDERALLGLDLVGDVVAHERAVVQEALGLEDARRPNVHVPGGGPIAGWPHAEVILEEGELPPHDDLLLLAIEEPEGLVDVAVGADLMPGV